MKSKVYAILGCFLLSVAFCPLALAVDSIKVSIDDYPMVFDRQPQILNNRVMLPLRSVFECLGAEVLWEAETQTITGRKNMIEIRTRINSKTALINGVPQLLDVPPVILEERTLVPARFIAESLGAGVNWNEASQTVEITSGGLAEETRYLVLEHNLIKSANEPAYTKYMVLAEHEDYQAEKYLKMEKQIKERHQVEFQKNGRYYGPEVSGWGVFYWNNGDCYIGHFQNGRRTGMGYYAWPDGHHYVGEFRNDLISGVGIAYLADRYYAGIWKNDQRNGKGIWVEDNGARHLSHWVDNNPEGVEIIYSTTGAKYIGEYDSSGVKDIAAMVQFENGEKFVGYARAGAFRSGKYLFKEGLIYLGDFDVNHKRSLARYYISSEQHILDIHKESEGILSAIIQPQLTERQKAKAIHDYIILNVRYDAENADQGRIPLVAHTLYGAMVNKTAVCDGYAELFCNLALRSGLECQIISGEAGDEEKLGDWEGHAWNLIKLEGKVYHVDVTWDDPDQGEQVLGDYFLVSADKMTQTHRWDQSKYPS